jgi:hypothetical protein
MGSLNKSTFKFLFRVKSLFSSFYLRLPLFVIWNRLRKYTDNRSVGLSSYMMTSSNHWRFGENGVLALRIEGVDFTVLKRIRKLTYQEVHADWGLLFRVCTGQLYMAQVFPK